MTQTDVVETTAEEIERQERRAEKERLAEEQAEQGGEVLKGLATLPDRVIPGTDLSIVPGFREMQGLAAMAVTLAGAQALPAALRNHPNDVFLVLLTARDLGVATTTAIREFHVIDGKVTISPKAKLAMVNERGRREGWAVWPDPANSDEIATWYATRDDRPGVQFSYTFTMKDAQAAGLLGKDNWKKYRARMMSWRALGYLMDDVFPEIGTGLYSPDELGAMTDEEGQPVIDVRAVEPLQGMRSPKGHTSEATEPVEMTVEQMQERWALQERVYALPDDAKATLVERWKGMQRLRGVKLADLPADCFGIVAAVIKGLEQQVKTQTKGEWDPEAALAAVREQEAMVLARLLCPTGWGATSPSAPDVTPDDTTHAETQENPGDGESGANPPDPEQPSLTDAMDDHTVIAEAGDEQVKATVALIKAMSMQKVDAELEGLKLETTGAADTRRHRLAVAYLRRIIRERAQ